MRATVACLLAWLAAGPAVSLELWVAGGESSWVAAGGRLDTANVVARPGWLRPDSLSASDNLALASTARGGGVNSPQGVMRLQEAKAYEGSKGRNLMGNMVDGDPESVFEMDEESARGTLTGFVVLDLGTVVPGVRRLRFYPRPTRAERFLRGFDLAVNDGDPGSRDASGGPLWDPVARDDENTRATVTVDIEPQPVRFVRLQSRTTLPWEVAELEVYGGGFVRQAAYTSPVLDLGGEGGLANLGFLTWEAEVDPKAQLVVRTRSGSTPDPNRYVELLIAEGDTAAVALPDPARSGTALAQYQALPPERRRLEPDLENWSAWSAPHVASGERIASPSPRRFAQLTIDLASFDYRHRAQVDSIAFTYSTPVFARRLQARLVPLQVAAGEDVTFDYTLTAEVGQADRGFDALRVATPVAVRAVTDARIDGLPVALDSLHLLPDAFELFFPRFTAENRELSFRFVGRVLVFGSQFASQVFARDLPEEVPQAPDRERSQLAVSVVLDNTLLPSLAVSPPVVTPNGDGVNDVTAVTYQVLKVLEPVPVRLEVFDLAGRCVWSVRQRQAFGVYHVPWDGAGLDGRPLPPGTYVVRVEVESETVTDARAALVGVAF